MRNIHALVLATLLPLIDDRRRGMRELRVIAGVQCAGADAAGSEVVSADG